MSWCWERLTPLLQQAGHGVVTMDLPLEDSTATFDTYADVVCSALDDCGDDVVLVGHSYAGNTIPLVAARRPVRHLVFLCAMIPDVGRSLAQQLTDKPEMLNPVLRKGIERARRSAVSAVDRAWHRTRHFLFRLRRADRARSAGSPSTAVGQSCALSVLTDRTPTSADDVRRVQRRPDAVARMVSKSRS